MIGYAIEVGSEIQYPLSVVIVGGIISSTVLTLLVLPVGYWLMYWDKKDFIETYTQNVKPTDEKIAIFTAGMSGVGKTELATFLTEQNPNLLHIDTDEIREFFRPIGYDGQNSNLYQKVASRGFSFFLIIG